MNRATLARFVALFATLTACGPYADPLAAESGNPECGTDHLAKLIAGRAIDLERACGTTPVEKCADILKQPVFDKWEPRFTAWERCD